MCVWPLRQALRAIAYYVTQIIALYDPDSDASAAVVANALAPIPDFRERSRREQPAEITPESPLPNVETDAPATAES